MDGTRPCFAVRRPAIWLTIVLILASLGWIEPAAAAKLRISNRYSPLNNQRPVRERTDYIVLHTTEGSDQPSLARIRRGGLAHYVVLRNGRVYRIISRQREARHAGRSMWNGRQNIDQVSLGIEVVGYHNRDLTGAQVTALAELLRQLQSLYDIPDANVLTHSMVAYGSRNRWHRHDHRGRKRCGMLFARPEVRAQLGLEDQPHEDPDVLAGRLTVGDPFLATVLFNGDTGAARQAEAQFAGPDANVITPTRTAWFIARDQYDDPTTVYVLPSGQRRRGNEIRDWSRVPRGTVVLMDQEPPAAAATPTRSWRVIGQDGTTASAVAGPAHRHRTTLYVEPGGRIRRGDQMSERDFRRLAPGTRVFLGYEYAGEVTPRRTAYDLCGPHFRRDTTLYLMPGGRVRTGSEIRENRIPGGTLVLVRSLTT
jgi:hypothetical protein